MGIFDFLKRKVPAALYKPKAWALPVLTIPQGQQKYSSDFAQAKLMEVLTAFKIKGKIVSVIVGPVVTRFEFDMEAGGKIATVERLSADIGRCMCTSPARIAPIPMKSTIAIELPNQSREIVRFSQIIKPLIKEVSLPLFLGKDVSGNVIFENLALFPHLLVAGTTGSGKSVALNAFISSMLVSRTPDEVKFIMIDPKMLEFAAYRDIPHLLFPVIVDGHLAERTVIWAIGEMERRYQMLYRQGAKNLDAYNAKAKKKLPRIVIVVDEYADLLSICGKEFENHIQRLAQKSRAAGIHIILATQRPSVDVVTGIIKANFPARICFRVISKHDSTTVLSDRGAENLLGNGDMIFQSTTMSPTRIHGPLISEDEIELITNHWRGQGRPDYVVLPVPPPVKPEEVKK